MSGRRAALPPDARQRLAKVVTEAFAPTPLAVIGVVVVAWHASEAPGDALKWGLLGAAFAPLFPFLHLLRQIRRGRVTDRHVRLREQRAPILLVALASAFAALAVLALLGAPRELVGLFAAGVASLIVALTITFAWKISIHVGVAAGLLTVFTLLVGPAVLAAAPIVVLVAWARVELRDHTPAQVVAGGVIGALVSGGTFALVTALPG